MKPLIRVVHPGPEVVLTLSLISSLLFTGCGSESPIKPDPEPQIGPITSIVIVGGNGQSATVGTQLPESLEVQVLDANGRGVPDRRIDFSVTTGEGSLSVDFATTDGSGKARTQWTLGTSASGAHQVVAQVTEPSTGVSLTAQFTATARAGAPSAVTVSSGDAQSAGINAALEQPLVVGVTDQYDNPVANVEVVWSATAGGGSLDPSVTTTNGDGQAATTWTLGPLLGSPQEVQATVGAATPARFSATGLLLTEWEELAPMPIAVRAPAVAAGDGTVFVVGGTASGVIHSKLLQIYDVASNTWLQGPDLPVGRDWATAAYMNGRVHVIGGVTDQSAASDDHWIYDPVTNMWTAGPDSPLPSAGSAIGTLDSRIFLFGGIDGPSAHSDNTMIFDTATEQWTMGTPVPSPRINWSGASVGEVILAVGGGTPTLGTTTQLVQYDPDADAWTQLPPIPLRREAHGSGTVGRFFCSFGGRTAASGNQNTPFDSTFCYVSDEEIWLQVSPLPRALQEVVGAVLDGFIYAMGGRNEAGAPVADASRLSIR